jgi:hypothetical protein
MHWSESKKKSERLAFMLGGSNYGLAQGHSEEMERNVCRTGFTHGVNMAAEEGDWK